MSLAAALVLLGIALVSALVVHSCIRECEGGCDWVPAGFADWRCSDCGRWR